jgi:2-hydroxychromene-2-carboxylate isomerase
LWKWLLTYFYFGTYYPVKSEHTDNSIREHLEEINSIRPTQLAADRGVFGSPAFIVGDDLFFGNDRLDFLEARLSKSRSDN